jgi:hypothetical protein
MADHIIRVEVEGTIIARIMEAHIINIIVVVDYLLSLLIEHKEVRWVTSCPLILK